MVHNFVTKLIFKSTFIEHKMMKQKLHSLGDQIISSLQVKMLENRNLLQQTLDNFDFNQKRLQASGTEGSNI